MQWKPVGRARDILKARQTGSQDGAFEAGASQRKPKDPLGHSLLLESHMAQPDNIAANAVVGMDGQTTVRSMTATPVSRAPILPQSGRNGLRQLFWLTV